MQDTARADQVCDRCRRRKIRCAGDKTSARCAPCTIAQVPCLRSAALRRNRKRKSFYENEAMQERLLEQHQENGNLEIGQAPPTSTAPPARNRPVEFAQNLILQQASPRQHAGTDSNDLSTTPRVAVSCDSRQGGASTPQGRPLLNAITTDPVVGHMGRLVPNDGGVSLFAGSTSGVHFVSQTEQTMQQLKLSTNQYPNSAYSLHLHSATRLDAHEDDLSLIANILPQIQSNAITIIDSTVDFLTPLYPVIHKPSSLPIYRHLLVGTGCKYPLVQLYQVLLLLAVGSIGTPSSSCAKQHRHVLCHSEYYYSMATVISARVMTVSCLETLQGLVLAQIYLQVSSRGAEALQLGGVATRLAQSLGLHRHSARFKMSPLETEMRRRLWGCQCTLDTFASTYHGMPRLIRTQDVDADNPTPVDNEQMTSSHIAFPLPGERSEIDYAICAFSIGRTLGKTLERLYTTTDRRGGVEKIRQLQAEVNLWTGALPAEVTNDDFLDALDSPISSAQLTRSPKDTHNNLSDTDSGTGASLGAIFLRIIKCITTIHIHRPALAFTSSNAQVLESLRVCTSSSAYLIRIMASVMNPRNEDEPYSDTQSSPEALHKRLLLSSLYPNGVHMLWQAGLTILFSKWKGHSIEVARTRQDSDDVSQDNGFTLVFTCAATMREILSMCDYEELPAHSIPSSNGINICANVLEQLAKRTWPNAHGSGVLGWNSTDERDVPNPTYHSQSATLQSPKPSLSRSQRAGYEGMWQQQSPSWDLWDWPMASALDLANILDVLPFEMPVAEEQGAVQHNL